jgi:hypothetical protein
MKLGQIVRSRSTAAFDSLRGAQERLTADVRQREAATEVGLNIIWMN